MIISHELQPGLNCENGAVVTLPFYSSEVSAAAQKLKDDSAKGFGDLTRAVNAVSDGSVQL